MRLASTASAESHLVIGFCGRRRRFRAGANLSSKNGEADGMNLKVDSKDEVMHIEMSDL